MNTMLVLASASPRRQALLRLLGVPFVVRVSRVDEAPHPDEPPAAMARRLSRAKAWDVTHEVSDGWVLAADTLVVLESQVLGKPTGAAEATAMLRRLRGRAHEVITAFTLVDVTAQREHTEAVTSRVWMRDYSDAEIEAYVASGDPMDKAGAYAIQDPGFAPVARVEGCPANVMGLPVCRVERVLRAWGAPMRDTPVRACRPEASECQIEFYVLGSGGR